MTITPTINADIPLPRSGAQRQHAYRSTPRGRKAKAHEYLSKPFQPWDGEGITLPDGSHIYTLLATIYPGESQPRYVHNPDGLSTATCLEFIHDNVSPRAHNIIYGGGYDANMWITDFSWKRLQQVWRHGTARHGRFRIAWQPGKRFGISDNARSVVIYDVISFFQCAFVKACDEYLGEDYPGRDIIVAGKAQRDAFASAGFADILAYTTLELSTLRTLITELRERLDRAGIRPRGWYGPGAIAAALMQERGIKRHLATTPPDVAQAARHAYAGGRFEVIKYGHVERPAYEYDINSAYPAALARVPSLSSGYWRRGEHYSGANILPDFALYKIEWHGCDPRIPGPLFYRHKNGTISYPTHGSGWYWGPEANAARAYFESCPGGMSIQDMRIFVEESDARPFAFIPELYRARQVLRAAGDGAHVGYKLGLNSLYGKLAQQVGARCVNGEWRTPPYHQLEYAGYVTASCRAQILRAITPQISDVIAIETDAVFSERPLPVPQGDALGEWKEISFPDLTYIQSGLYFAGSDRNKATAKTRGVDRGQLQRTDVLDMLAQGLDTVPVVLRRFVGAGYALNVNHPHEWRRWLDVEKRVALEPSGKRVHTGCPACRGLGGLTLGEWHSTRCPFFPAGMSAEYPVAWINPDPGMTMLDEFRERVTDYETGWAE